MSKWNCQPFRMKSKLHFHDSKCLLRDLNVQEQIICLLCTFLAFSVLNGRVDVSWDCRGSEVDVTAVVLLGGHGGTTGVKPWGQPRATWGPVHVNHHLHPNWISPNMYGPCSKFVQKQKHFLFCPQLATGRIPCSVPSYYYIFLDLHFSLMTPSVTLEHQLCWFCLCLQSR